MKLTSLLRLLLLALAGGCVAAAQVEAPAPASPYRISGIVLGSTNESPVAHSHLTATLVPRGSSTGRQFPAPIGTFDADEHGRFSIPLPSAGMWRVTASAPGYVTQAYDEHEAFSSGIVLTAATPEMDLRFRISPEAVISGKVLDEAGEAVRHARVSLMTLRPEGPDSIQPPPRTRAVTTTDDRGAYEFDDLPPGDYRINVQAQVWYAVAAQPRRFDKANEPPPDPSLDVTYPLTWYPGSSDPDGAETISLHAGDSHQADFQLRPIPSLHLRILPDTGADAHGRRVQSYPMVQQISSDGGIGFVPISAHMDSQGAVDVGGLAPGRYEIRMQGPGQEMKSTLVDVSAGSVQAVDMSAPTNMASVTLHVDGIAEEQANSVQINLVDPATGRNSARSSRGAYVLSGALLRKRNASATDRVVEVPPGRYEIVLSGKPNIFLTGITAQSADAVGRLVNIPSGSSTLTIHVAEGRATLTGIATIQGKPSVGAMVLLVPATLGNPASLNIIRRDQTNTDGSFDLNDVLPGQYILLAIDHGWHVNWRDPATLRGYMMHGVPIDLASTASLKQNIEAQAP
jgi:hypothetical protein